VGGTGFLGHHICKKLIIKKYKVFSLSSKRPNKNRLVKGVKYIVADIRSKNKLKILDQKEINHVINLAGYIDHSGNKKNLKTHFNGTKNLVNKFLKKDLKVFIQAGTCLENGKISSPQNESKKEKPAGKYGKSKLKASLYLEKIGKKFDFPYVVLRIYQIYGPNQNTNRLIPFVILSCLKKIKFPCTYGKQIRDFLYVDDFVNLILKILKSKKKIKGIFNVGSTKPIKIKTLIGTIKRKVGKGIPLYGKVAMRKDEQMLLYPDTKKIRTAINWRAKFSLSTGINKTIEFYKKFLNKNKKQKKTKKY
jgi:nucleoside-diphosphate-sugar epimerase